MAIKNFNEHLENSTENYLIKTLMGRLQDIKSGDLILSKLTYRLSIIDDLLSELSDDFLKDKIINDINKYL